jgi:hypothetical protein
MRVGWLVVLAILSVWVARPAFAQSKAAKGAKAVVKTGKAPTMIKGFPSAKAAPAKTAEKKGEHGNLPTVSKTARAARVVKVDPETVARNRLAAAKIDSLVEANYEHFHVEPNPLTTDEQFVRRIYLDITGTIPTYEQTVVFLDSQDEHKREKLIDQLLNSPGYASHFFNYWANILRLQDFPENNLPAAPYIEWIKQSLRDNVPYDEWVREMLTAEGKIFDNPAAGYLLRDSGMPLDSMNNTVRVFLGTQIGCAQCHDHPFDRWKQHEFYEMAAFMFGVRTRGGAGGMGVNKLRDELMKIKGANGAIQLVRANTYEVKDNPRQVLKLPHDYQYDDGKPGQVVKPKVIFGDAPISGGETPRAAFAHWLTSKDNPRFGKAIANRLWKRALGVGIIEPVDDIKDNSQPENPELLDYLTTIVTKLDFDLKEYQRIIYNTKSYQRQSSTVEPYAGDPYHFAGPVLRRMTAEQVWDSLLTLAIYNADAIRRPSMDGVAQVADLDLAKVTAKEIAEKWEKYNTSFGRKATQDMKQKYGYKGQLLARASEMPLPSPPGHFLREFGQGDREQIEAASTEGNVPQILTMFNGPVTHMMLEEGSVIYDDVMKRKTPNERVNVIFLTLLSRRPDAASKEIAVNELTKNGLVGCGDVIWSLLNTREFLFIQ